MRTGCELRSFRPAFFAPAKRPSVPASVTPRKALATIGNLLLVTIAPSNWDNSVGICTQSSYIRQIDETLHRTICGAIEVAHDSHSLGHVGNSKRH